MKRIAASQPMLLLLAMGPLFTSATSVFAALIVVGVLLICTPCAAVITRIANTSHLPPRGEEADVAPKMLCFTLSAIICAGIVATLLIALITAGLNDFVSAFTPQIVLAAFAATLTGGRQDAVPVAIKYSGLIAIVGLLCELLGHGTLLGDYEIAFAGALRDWRIQITEFAPLSLLATPGGALLIAGIVSGIVSALSHPSGSACNVMIPAITEPRSGRRVRVTGHIS